MSTLRRRDYFTLNVYWFALSYLWNSMGPIILPVIVPPLVDPNFKGTAIGLLSAVGLIVATIVQPMAGALSDRSAQRWGRRRPYLLGGTLLDMIFLSGIVVSGNYWLLFASYFLLQVSSNVAHGPYQGLIPDLVPEEKRGSASGVKQFLEIIGIIVTSLVTAQLMNAGQLGVTMGSIMAILLITMLITLWGVREQPLAAASVPHKPVLATVLGTFNVDVRRYADFLWWLGSRLLILIGINLVRNFAILFVQEVLQLPDAIAATGTLLAILAVAIAVVVYPAGFFSDRFGRKPLHYFAGIVGAIGAFLLIFTRGYDDLFIYGGIIGVAIGVFLSVNWALATDLIPPAEAARYLGISNLATAGAGVLANLFGGPLIDIFNAQQPGLGYTVLFALGGLCMLAGTALLLPVRETRGRGTTRGTY